MKTLKIGVILLALLLAAMAMVPIVSAVAANISEQKDTAALVNPQLATIESKIMGPE